jgi:hypothetical protein
VIWKIYFRNGFGSLKNQTTEFVSCFLAPAKDFVKEIKGHSGYYGCNKCVQRGEWQGKMTFPASDSPLRTDASFDEMPFEEHHIDQ